MSFGGFQTIAPLSIIRQTEKLGCIFRDAKFTKVRCNQQTFVSGMILCQDHMAEFFGLILKEEFTKNSRNVINKFYDLKFSQGTGDDLMPFPFKFDIKTKAANEAYTLDDVNLCLDTTSAIKTPSKIPEEVFMALLSNSQLSGAYINQTTHELDYSDAILNFHKHIITFHTALTNRWTNTHVWVYYNTADEPYAQILEQISQIKGAIAIPFTKLPCLYQFLFYNAQPGTVIAKNAKSPGEAIVIPPNLIVSISEKSIKYVNRKFYDDFYVYNRHDSLTYATPVVVLMKTEVPDLQQYRKSYGLGYNQPLKLCNK